MIRSITLRNGIAFCASVVAIWLCVNHDTGGMKGLSIPIANVVMCVVVSGIAAYFVTRSWSWVAAPFVAGVVGAFATGFPMAAPFGGALGLSVGTAITAWFVRASLPIASS